MIARWKLTSYCLCNPSTTKGHFERSNEGVWMLADDAAEEIKRLEADNARHVDEKFVLAGNLRLAEEGLANYAQENGQLRALLARAVDTMSALHRSIEPMEDDPELAGRVPPAAMRAFVDALADIDRERFSLPQSEKP